MGVTSIISNIAMISNAIATIAILLRGHSQMSPMNCNTVYGTPVMTPQGSYVTYPQPMNYGYGYAQPEQTSVCQPNPYVANPVPVNQVYHPQMTQTYYNAGGCSPIWSIDPSRYNVGYQPMDTNAYADDIWINCGYGMVQNQQAYGYNYNPYDYQSRRMNNYNPYPYNWPYQDDTINPNGITQHVNIQQMPPSPWAKQSTPPCEATQSWNHGFINNPPSNEDWTKYIQPTRGDPWSRRNQLQGGWSENNHAYRYGARL